MLKFIKLVVALVTVTVTCFCFAAPERSRSMALRCIESIDARTRKDDDDASGLQVTLVHKALTILRDAGADRETGESALQEGTPGVASSEQIQDAFFSDRSSATDENFFSGLKLPFTTPSSEYQPIDTGATIQANPFLK